MAPCPPSRRQSSTSRAVHLAVHEQAQTKKARRGRRSQRLLPSPPHPECLEASLFGGHRLGVVFFVMILLGRRHGRKLRAAEKHGSAAQVSDRDER